MKLLEFLELTMLNRFVIAFNYCQVKVVKHSAKDRVRSKLLKAIKY